MKYHASLLEKYCQMFEDTQKMINLPSEFTKTIINGQKFDMNSINEYLQTKISKNMASDLAGQFRGLNSSQGG